MPIGIDLSGVLNGGGPLINLEAPTTYNVSKFPSDIADTPYFVIFRSISRTNAAGSLLGKVFKKLGAKNVNAAGTGLNFGQLNISTKIPTKGYALPIPSNLSTSYNARYSNEGLGALGSMGRRLGSNFESPEDFNAQSISDSISNAVRESEFGTGDLTGGAANMAISAVEGGAGAAAIVSKLLGSSSGAAALAAGVVQGLRGGLVGAGIARNPHLAAIFTGVDFRTHTFEYKLIAKNKKESDTLRDMIRGFKYAMAPNYALGDHIFQYPNEFDITLCAGPYLFKLGRSVLTQFNVNYTGEGTPAFFESTAAPYSVTISMSFQETSIVTKREINQGR